MSELTIKLNMEGVSLENRKMLSYAITALHEAARNGSTTFVQIFNEKMGDIPPKTMEKVRAVVKERIRQHRKWGDQNHTPAEWLAILTEEVGEVATNVVEFNQTEDRKYFRDMLTELVQVAAVAVQILEIYNYEGDEEHN